VSGAALAVTARALLGGTLCSGTYCGYSTLFLTAGKYVTTL